MARKGAAAAINAGEPRRSSRIKDQPKPDPPSKKAPAKPRTRKPKATGEGDAGDKEKYKSAAGGKKRTAAEKDTEDAQPAVNGEDAAPPAKKVNFRPHAPTPKLIVHLGQT
jgi:hypothetical protein